MNDASFAAVDRLSSRIINSLHGLLGVSYSDRFEHFVYHGSVTFPASTAQGNSQSTVIRISQEAAFFATSIRFLMRMGTGATNPGLAVGYQQVTAATSNFSLPDAGVLVQITDGGNDRLLHSEPVDAGLVYGTTGNSSSQLSKPKLFKPNSSVSVVCTLLKTLPASEPVTVRVAFIGFKVYRGDGATSQTFRG